jgi:hypothetical protein
MGAPRHPLGYPETGTEPAGHLRSIELVTQVSLYVRIVGQRREGVHEPEEPGPELWVVHGSRKQAIGPPGEVEHAGPLPAAEIGDAPGQLFYFALVGR